MNGESLVRERGSPHLETRDIQKHSIWWEMSSLVGLEHEEVMGVREDGEKDLKNELRHGK